jgi:hypothetical protein
VELREIHNGHGVGTETEADLAACLVIDVDLIV